MGVLVQPVILAGGAGTRLWPASTPARPKHLLELVGEGSLMRQTIDRVSDPQLFSRPIVVCSERQAGEVAALAPDCHLILETHARGSAAAVALAAHSVSGETMLLVLPSDHHVTDPTPLFHAIEHALPVARDGHLVTFGIKPFRPETGYGYIEAGAPISEGVLEARGFVEKPPRDVAAELISSGKSYWNSGMFMFMASAFLEELRRYSPAICGATRAAMEEASMTAQQTRPDPEALEQSPADSIDYAVMEHSDRIVVAPLDIGWSDIGNWAAVFELAEKDHNNNVIDDRSHALGVRNCLIRSSGPTVVAIGIEDLVVVATADHVLIVPRSEAQRVREAAEASNGSVVVRRASDG